MDGGSSVECGLVTFPVGRGPSGWTVDAELLQSSMDLAIGTHFMRINTGSSEQDFTRTYNFTHHDLWIGKGQLSISGLYQLSISESIKG